MNEVNAHIYFVWIYVKVSLEVCCISMHVFEVKGFYVYVH